MNTRTFTIISCIVLWIFLGVVLSSADTLNNVDRLFDDTSKGTSDLEAGMKELQALLRKPHFEQFKRESPLLSHIGLPAKRAAGDTTAGARLGTAIMPLYLLIQDLQNQQNQQERLAALDENQRLFADGGKRRK